MKKHFSIILYCFTLCIFAALVSSQAIATPPKKQTSSEALIRYLEMEGVTKVFGVPGEETLHLMDAIRKSKKIQFVLTANEQGASFMATGYSRATGKLGVALSTLGPGATNLVTGTANAESENIRLLLITGQGPVKRPIGYHQKLDLTSLFSSITRLSLEARTGRAVVNTARKLITAANKNPGPVHLSLPSDVASQTVKVGPPPTLAPRMKRARPSAKASASAARLIKSSKFPVIVAGDGVLQNKAGHTAKGILAFAKAYNIPVIPSAIAKGMFPWANRHVLPPLDAFAKGKGADLVRKSDLIISVGYHPTETFEPQNFNPGGKKKIVHISTQKLPAEHHIKGMTPTVELTGGLITGLVSIKRRLGGYRAPDTAMGAANKIRTTHEMELSRYMADRGKAPIKPQQIMGELRRTLDKITGNGKKGKALVFGDVGLNKGMMNQWLPVGRPGEVMMPNGMSTMGVSMPAAVGAKIALPKLNVLSVSGDGGLLMNVQELATAAKYKLPTVHLVLIDKRLGLIENHQRRNSLTPSGVDVSKLDLVSLAKGMGARGHMVRKVSDIGPLVRRALKRKGPTLIGIPVDYSEAQAMASRIGAASTRKAVAKPRRTAHRRSMTGKTSPGKRLFRKVRARRFK